MMQKKYFFLFSCIIFWLISIFFLLYKEGIVGKSIELKDIKEKILSYKISYPPSRLMLSTQSVLPSSLQAAPDSRFYSFYFLDKKVGFLSCNTLEEEEFILFLYKFLLYGSFLGESFNSHISTKLKFSKKNFDLYKLEAHVNLGVTSLKIYGTKKKIYFILRLFLPSLKGKNTWEYKLKYFPEEIILPLLILSEDRLFLKILKEFKDRVKLRFTSDLFLCRALNLECNFKKNKVELIISDKQRLYLSYDINENLKEITFGKWRLKREYKLPTKEELRPIELTYLLAHIPKGNRIKNIDKLTCLTVRLEPKEIIRFIPEDKSQRWVSKRDGILEIKKQRIKDSLPIPIGYFHQYTLPSVGIESDDLKIKELAKNIIKDTKDSFKATELLCNWVYFYLDKEPTGIIPSALQVLKDKKGDCTEHSYLLVALLRAVGIPSYICIGLKYNEGMFFYHAWVKAFVGEWIDVDPTFNQSIADVGRITLFNITDFNIESMINQGMVLLSSLYNDLKITIL